MNNKVETILAYTRADAIADGVLVDLRQGDLASVVQDAGVKYPIACTEEVFFSCIDLTPAAKRAGNDICGRLWDILHAMKLSLRRSTGDTVNFELLIVQDSQVPTRTQLKAVCGPGDNMEPVITIMFSWQD